MCKLKNVIILLLVCFALSFSAVSTCSAAQADTVTIPMQDYQQLKSSFLTLQSNNEKQQQLLNQLKEQLALSATQQGLSAKDWILLRQQLNEAQEQTKKLQAQCETLQKQLADAKSYSTAAEQSLTDAQQSLTELSKAIKAERAAAERRETILKIIAGAAIIYGASK